MNDDQLLLASAYLDGDVDAAERARAEADPEVMAEVDRLRSVQTALRDVGAPDPLRREQALDAALAAFADEPAPAAVPPPPPVPLPRRQQRSWWGGVLAAAAALVVVVAGVVVLRGAGGGGGNDDDSASFATDSDELRLTAEDTAGADTGAAAPAAPDGADQGDAESQSAPAATESADGTTAAGSLLADRGPDLATPDDLAAFAAGTPATSLQPPSCQLPGAFIGPATYDGTPVEVFVDATTVTAVDAATCVVVEQVER